MKRDALALAELATLQDAATGAAPSAERAQLRDHGAGAWAQTSGFRPEPLDDRPRVSPPLGEDYDEVLPAKEQEATDDDEQVVHLSFGQAG